MIFLSMVLRHCPAIPGIRYEFHKQTPLIVAFIPGQSPPDVNIPIFIAFDVKL